MAAGPRETVAGHLLSVVGCWPTRQVFASSEELAGAGSGTSGGDSQHLPSVTCTSFGADCLLAQISSASTSVFELLIAREQLAQLSADALALLDPRPSRGFRWAM